MVFIDGSNLYHNLREEYRRTDVSFEKLCTVLCGENRDLVRGYYYNAVVDQTRDPEAFRSHQRFLDPAPPGSRPGDQARSARLPTGIGLSRREGDRHSHRDGHARARCPGGTTTPRSSSAATPTSPTRCRP